MKKYLIIRFGELFLKKRNRAFFVDSLISNLKKSLLQKENDLSEVRIERSFDQLFIDVDLLSVEKLEKLKGVLSKTFGIDSYYLGHIAKGDLLKSINFYFENFEKFLKINFASFRLSFKRNDKKFPINSQDLQRTLGSLVAKKYKLKPNLENYEKNIEVSIYKGFVIFFSERVRCLGGLPIGSSGSVLLLFSGGLDSSVAAFNLMKRGLEVVYLHFYVNEKHEKGKIFDIIEKLSPFNNYKKDVYLINTKEILREISHVELESYRITLLKRMFFRYAEKIADLRSIQAIANGDSLGQVASQTIESLNTIYSVVNSKLIITPLITRDKQEIIDEARKIGVYELAIRDYEDCCLVFQPKHPVVKPKSRIAEQLEEKILWKFIVENAKFDLIEE